MRMKSFVFVFLFFFAVVLPSFFAETQQSGSGSLPKPTMEFKSWQVGRGSVGSEINNIVHTSFITSTETECRFTASVGYKGGNLPQGSVSPIDPDTVVWSIVEPNHGMALADGSLKHNWSGSHPSKLSGTTSFNVIGKLNVPEYQPTPKPAICLDENNHLRGGRTPTHRGNTKLAFKIKFTAQTQNGQTVSEVLSLKQYPIDQVRQEYVDLNKMIPDRVDPKWWSQDTYDFGHYQVMLNAGLYNYHQKWVDAINDLYRKNKLALSISDFTLNSGYRNPHHNYHHAGSTAGLSPHMYGYAIDVQGRDVDGNGTMDKIKMRDAAKAKVKDGGAGAREALLYSNTDHVHADWARPDWYAFSKTPGARAGDAPSFSLPLQGTDSPLHGGNNNNNGNNGNSGNSGNSKALHTCGVHETSVSGSHSYSTYTCGSHSGYACQESNDHKTYISSCSETENGRTCNNSSGYYECSPHSHTYPSYHACGVHLRSATGNHSLRSFCWSRDSNGYGCTVTNFYACDGHSHTYPNSADVTCAAGHTYSSTHRNVSYLNNYHRTRTCRRSGCGQSWQACVNGWTAPRCLARPGHGCWAQ